MAHRGRCSIARGCVLLCQIDLPLPDPGKYLVLPKPSSARRQSLLRPSENGGLSVCQPSTLLSSFVKRRKESGIVVPHTDRGAYLSLFIELLC